MILQPVQLPPTLSPCQTQRYQVISHDGRGGRYMTTLRLLISTLLSRRSTYFTKGRKKQADTGSLDGQGIHHLLLGLEVVYRTVGKDRSSGDELLAVDEKDSGL